MRTSLLIACLMLGACASPPRVEPVAVQFVNASRATRCAEEDNVYVRIVGGSVSRFGLRAEHPPYIGQVREDSTAPDFTHCDMSGDPSYAFEPRTVVLHDQGDVKLVGHTFPTFWRPARVEVRVHDRSETGLHLLQLIRRGGFGELEQLVVYPSDGYWRLKPMPPDTLPNTAYGSSFLFGPIEEDGRPFVDLRLIEFDPASLRFRVTFADGRVGTLRVVETSRTASALDLRITPPLPDGRAFAALRSMFVSNANADVSLAQWTRDGQSQRRGVLDFEAFDAASARFGRQSPSLHNLTAPDFVFGPFEGRAPAPDRRAASR